MNVYFYGGKLSRAKTESAVFPPGGTRGAFSRATGRVALRRTKVTLIFRVFRGR